MATQEIPGMSESARRAVEGREAALRAEGIREADQAREAHVPPETREERVERIARETAAERARQKALKSLERSMKSSGAAKKLPDEPIEKSN